MKITEGFTWTGIGSRGMPKKLNTVCNDFGYYMASQGCVLESGAAEGPDMEFEKGVIGFMRSNNMRHLMHIHLPWPSFGNRKVDNIHYIPIGDTEFKLAWILLTDSGVCTWLHNMKQSVQKLFCRNVYQIVKADWSMSDIVVYWGRENREKNTVEGGTRIAVYLARHFNIPCFNLAYKEDRDKLTEITGFDFSQYNVFD